MDAMKEVYSDMDFLFEDALFNDYANKTLQVPQKFDFNKECEEFLNIISSGQKDKFNRLKESLIQAKETLIEINPLVLNQIEDESIRVFFEETLFKSPLQ